MAYLDGSLIPVPASNKKVYRDIAERFNAVIIEHGATRIVDAWGDDVPDGKVTDCRRAVRATKDENVVYSWIEWPSREVRDAGWQKVIADPRMYPDPALIPYDNKRRIHGGFTPVLDV